MWTTKEQATWQGPMPLQKPELATWKHQDQVVTSNATE